MNFVESFNLLGVEAKQIPCITGSGAPTATTEGEVGCFYMNIDTGELYKYTSVASNVNPWELVGSAGGLDLNNLTLSVAQNGDYQRLSMSDGNTTKYVDIPISVITDEQVNAAVEAWLDSHPEATTTVADGSVTFKKLGEDVTNKINNLIIDPAFEDITDTNKIQFVYVNVKSASDGVLTLGKTTGGQFRAIIKGKGDMVPGHMYYVEVQVKIDSPTVTNASSLEEGYGTRNLKLVDGWQRVYRVFTETVVGDENVTVRRHDDDTDPVTCYVKAPVLIDLTDAFGAGNEPSAEEFRIIFDELHDAETYTHGIFKDSYKVETINNRLNCLYARNCLEERVTVNNEIFGPSERSFTGNGSRITIGSSFPFANTQIWGKNYTGEYGDIIYWAASISFDDDDCTTIYIDYPNDAYKSPTKYGVYINSPEKNVWHRLSMVFEHTGVCYPQISCIYPSTETQNGKVVKIKKGILLNLTQIFGKGNEPTVDVVDAYLSSFPDRWFSGTQNIFNTSVIPHAFAQYHNIYDKSGYGAEDGRFVAKSIVDKYASCWSVGKYKYGITNTDKVPIPHDFSGSVKTDSMFISDGQYGAWSSDASGELSYGGHVFHGWNEIGTYRLSMMIGNSCVGSDQKREDEAAILVYSPSNLFNNPSRELTEEQLAGRITPNQEDYYGGNPTLLLGRVRIGSDVHNEGVVFQRKKTTFYGDVIMADSKRGAPPSNSEGEKGTIRFDDNYLYICTSPNTWRRCKLESY